MRLGKGMKKIAILLSALLCISAAQATDLYKIVHEDGRIEYTDKPVKGAVKITVGPSNRYKSRYKSSQQATQSRVGDDKVNASLNWVSPQQEHTVPPGAESLKLTVEVKPSSPDMLVQFFNRGVPLAVASTNRSFTVTNMERGEASYTAKLITRAGVVVSTTEPLIVHIKRPMVRPSNLPSNR